MISLAGKNMLSIFWDAHGEIQVNFLQKGITDAYYAK